MVHGKTRTVYGIFLGVLICLDLSSCTVYPGTGTGWPVFVDVGWWKGEDYASGKSRVDLAALALISATADCGEARRVVQSRALRLATCVLCVPLPAWPLWTKATTTPQHTLPLCATIRSKYVHIVNF